MLKAHKQQQVPTRAMLLRRVSICASDHSKSSLIPKLARSEQKHLQADPDTCQRNARSVLVNSPRAEHVAQWEPKQVKYERDLSIYHPNTSCTTHMRKHYLGSSASARHASHQLRQPTNGAHIAVI
jgi:hypothetical protein